MGADVLGQFIEALLCFGVGAYFGVKIAFTEVIGECSGKVLRFILELILGISYVLYVFVVILWFADGNLKYYHFVIEAIGALLILPIARKVFRRYKRGIQSIWLWLLGKNTDVDNMEPTVKEKKKSRKNKNKTTVSEVVLLDETLQKSGVNRKSGITNIHLSTSNKREIVDNSRRKSVLNSLNRKKSRKQLLKIDNRRRKSRHVETIIKK